MQSEVLAFHWVVTLFFSVGSSSHINAAQEHIDDSEVAEFWENSHPGQFYSLVLCKSSSVTDSNESDCMHDRSKIGQSNTQIPTSNTSSKQARPHGNTICVHDQRLLETNTNTATDSQLEAGKTTTQQLHRHWASWQGAPAQTLRLLVLSVMNSWHTGVDGHTPTHLPTSWRTNLKACSEQSSSTQMPSCWIHDRWKKCVFLFLNHDESEAFYSCYVDSHFTGTEIPLLDNKMFYSLIDHVLLRFCVQQLQAFCVFELFFSTRSKPFDFLGAVNLPNITLVLSYSQRCFNSCMCLSCCPRWNIKKQTKSHYI